MGRFLFLLVLCPLGLFAQKHVQRILLTEDIDLIQVNTANCFEVQVNTVDEQVVNAEANIEGEYVDNLNLQVVSRGSTIFIDAGFSPNFSNPNDKLSAHKVVSIVLNISLPKNRNVEVYGTSSRVVVNGAYKKLNIILSDGVCEVNNAVGVIKVKTQSGAIKVLSNAANISATTKYGEVSPNIIPNGFSTYDLQTVTGNIELIKTE
ncbi:hypothetical protein SAMN04488009_2535 [Maribacter sedimenticola]|uniref:Adhesin domain-containing protein n=1 Tax=Maribacter sedimenticola TaxID=228956 RepID=A0ABY1SIB5_9FLAO|nr:DUF4097 family beta strand repeat-containing protein [Maribacter sedimenticola]SNR57335.1 hypothetical protein SAMN04488009_2535 [Maribacter sedimenticola]